MKKIKLFVIVYTLLFNSIVFAAPKAKGKGVKLDISQLALPSEVKNLRKSPGSIYYNPSVKDKPLIPVHFWGQVQKSGLHFVPVNTNLLNGLSFAGGPKDNAVLENVKVTTKRSGKRELIYFDLENGGELDSEDFVLRPGDTVFIKKDNFREDRSYYTSLIGVVATVLSSVLLYKEIKRR